jgi:bifunctional non-homologous end joining protein LigD
MIPIAQTSGSKGIQVYAAIAPTRSKAAWGYVKQLNASCTRPSQTSSSRPCPSSRAGRIYVDYNQNLAARNTIAPYSMRGRERPAVATPVTWEELGGVRGPDDFDSAQKTCWPESLSRGIWRPIC